MRWLKRYRAWALGLSLTAGVLLPLAPGVVAQEEDGATFLENLIQEQLSGTGREVRVTGFEGALSSNATLERLTIADDNGIWLTLEDASLDWSRAALLRGRLEVSELTAASIDIARRPISAPAAVTPEDAEATPFALPDLPVSINIGTLSAEEVTLGPDILGEAAVLSLTASLSFESGAGEADLDITRLDRPDAITLDAAFSNATRMLRIALDFDEAEGGLVGRALGIPETPPLRLQVTGDAPLEDFTAEIALSSSGVERFGGTVQIADLTEENKGPGQSFAADLSGDLRPLVSPDLHPFFGSSASLRASGTALSDGQFTLDRLALQAGALDVTGSAALAADGWPERFDLNGTVGNGDGTPLLLPGSGARTTLGALDFSTTFDAAQGEAWQAEARLADLAQEAVTLGEATLSGSGTISRTGPPTLTADMRIGADGLGFADPALARAIGTALSGTLSFIAQQDAPLQITALDVIGGDASLAASGTVDGLTEGFPIAGQARVQAADLTRFAALLGRDLGGAARIDLAGEGTALGGTFDLTLDANTTDLATGEPRLDPLLRGRGTLSVEAQRDETGITLRALDLDTPALDAQASGRIGGTRGTLDLTAEVSELSLVDARVTGPARFNGGLAWSKGAPLRLSAARLEALSTSVKAEGTVDVEDPDLPATGQVTIDARDLSALSSLAGRPLSGALDLRADGAGEILGRQINAAISATGTGLRSGIAQVDALTGGTLRLETQAQLGDGPPHLENFRLVTPRLTATASSPAPGEPIALSARLSDLGLVAPGQNGPARLDGTARVIDEAGDEIDVDLTLGGPGGANARVQGRVRELGRALALDLRGSLPLAVANSYIAPRAIQGPLSFNMRLDGPARLSSLSGEARIENARVALPDLGRALQGLTGTLRLSNGRLTPDITGNLGTGGSLRVTGPITLSQPFQSQMEIRFDGLGVSDPNLYRTNITGRLGVDGPLTGGARITGALQLGETVLLVPSGDLGSTPGGLKGIRHIAEPSAVRQTRARAGLIEEPGSGRRASAGRGYPLDILVLAPNRIFVRGRGLDAELGGRLRLRGTTNDLAPSGFFDLIRGRMDVLTKRINLTEGRVDLRGALDPFLRFVAETQTDDYTVRLILEGLASDPELSFTSVPDLPEEEVIAQLLFGRSFSDMSAFQAAQMVGAIATLSGRGSGGLTERLRSGLGLDDFDVVTTPEGATEFSAGSYISENVYSEVTTDSEGRNEINLNIDLNRNVTVKGSADNEGDTGVGIFFEKDY
jgi:translocation and assembly module TamB